MRVERIKPISKIQPELPPKNPPEGPELKKPGKQDVPVLEDADTTVEISLEGERLSKE